MDVVKPKLVDRITQNVLEEDRNKWLRVSDYAREFYGRNDEHNRRKIRNYHHKVVRNLVDTGHIVIDVRGDRGEILEFKVANFEIEEDRHLAANKARELHKKKEITDQQFDKFASIMAEYEMKETTDAT